MKKIISVALVLVMLFAMTVVSAAALDSPTGKKFYNITVLAEGKGTATSDKNKVDQTATGEDSYVTLTATPEGGYFTKWIMDGTYNKISGDEYSENFVIQPTSDIVATASFSEEEDYLNITTSVIGDGTAVADPAKVEKGSNDTVTLTATDGKDTFVDWTLECEYDIVSGDMKSRVLVIRPYTDVHAIAKFVGEGETVAPTQAADNSGKTSPKTGDPLFLVIALMALMTGVGVFAVKRVKE